MRPTRYENDSMGDVEIPEAALYGAQTQRAVWNFPVSGLRFQQQFIAALALIKLAAAKTNLELGILSTRKAEAIMQASEEVLRGDLSKHFVTDIFQTGSGTSVNMNANEVIANRAAILLGGRCGDHSLIHPNDDVNLGQSSNDVIPSAIHIAGYELIRHRLIPVLKDLENELQIKKEEFALVVKAARAHLRDAVPMTLGQEFGGYAEQITKSIERLEKAVLSLRELAIGGTAVGTGLNCPEGFPKRVIASINLRLGSGFIEAVDHFEAQSARDGVLEVSGQLRTLACSLLKIANDLRWLSSGPRCGLGEISLPALQPGSSIMPVKENPVICESVMMVCAQVIGNDACVLTSCQQGNLQLNAMLPVLAYNFIQAIEILSNVSLLFHTKCISGIRVNPDRCLDYAQKTLAAGTSLVPIIGYDLTAQVLKKALHEDKSIEAIVREMGLKIPAETLDLLEMSQIRKVEK